MITRIDNAGITKGWRSIFRDGTALLKAGDPSFAMAA